jgi:lipoate-protein ligase A
LNNIPILDLKNEGGTIVCGPGTIGLGFFTEEFKGHEYRDEIINTIVSKLKENGYNPIFSENDVLIENKKIMSSSSRRYGKLLFTAVLFSINTPIDLIK